MMGGRHSMGKKFKDKHLKFKIGKKQFDVPYIAFINTWFAGSVVFLIISVVANIVAYLLLNISHFILLSLMPISLILVLYFSIRIIKDPYYYIIDERRLKVQYKADRLTITIMGIIFLVVTLAHPYFEIKFKYFWSGFMYTILLINFLAVRIYDKISK